MLILINASFLAISLYLNTHTYINWDVSWLLETTKRLLAGGTYAQHFLETNPPLILFLYTIPVVLSGYIGSLTSNFLIFIYAICLLSLILSYRILQPLMQADRLGLMLFCSALVCCELIVPCYEFGQREHLTFLFIIPYVLLLASINTSLYPLYLRYTAGLLAGIGFAIKPHFLIPLIFIWCWELFKKRDLRGCISIENGCIVVVMSMYLLATLIITPDYFSFILPIVFKFYLTFNEPLFNLMTYPWSNLFYIVMLLGLWHLNQQQIPYRNLYEIILLCNLGFFLVFILGGRFFYYHFLISAAFSILLLILNIQYIYQKISTQSILSKFKYLHLSLPILAVFYFLSTFIDLDLRKLEHDYLGPVHPLLKAFETINQGPYAVFSIYMDPNTSLMTYSHLHSSTRFGQFWLLPTIAQLEQNGQLALAQEGKELLYQLLITDFLVNPPFIVVVDNTDPNEIIDGRRLNYLQFFLKDARFKTIWRNYHLAQRIETALGNYDIYTLAPQLMSS